MDFCSICVRLHEWEIVVGLVELGHLLSSSVLCLDGCWLFLFYWERMALQIAFSLFFCFCTVKNVHMREGPCLGWGMTGELCNGALCSVLRRVCAGWGCLPAELCLCLWDLCWWEHNSSKAEARVVHVFPPCLGPSWGHLPSQRLGAENWLFCKEKGTSGTRREMHWRMLNTLIGFSL